MLVNEAGRGWMGWHVRGGRVGLNAFVIFTNMSEKLNSQTREGLTIGLEEFYSGITV